MIAAKERIVRAFGRADDYDQHADVQQRAAEALASRLAQLPLRPRPHVLEFGCGTGFLAAAAASGLDPRDWLMTDISDDMLERSRRRFGGAPQFRFGLLDAEQPRLPPGHDRFDLVCSNLTAQWFDDLAGSVGRLAELVRPGGWLIFTILAAGTFAEWEDAHRSLGIRSGLRPLPGLGDLVRLRPPNMVADEVMHERFVRQHCDARDFLRSLRAIGAATPRAGHYPLSPAAMRAVMRSFEASGARASHVVATCGFRRLGSGDS